MLSVQRLPWRCRALGRWQVCPTVMPALGSVIVTTTDAFSLSVKWIDVPFGVLCLGLWVAAVVAVGDDETANVVWVSDRRLTDGGVLSGGEDGVVGDDGVVGERRRERDDVGRRGRGQA